MKLNLNPNWAQIHDKIQSIGFLIIKLNENIGKWYKNKNAVTGSNQWKFDNKTPKIQWNISLISRNNFEWNLIIKSWIFQWKSIKILIYPLIEIDRKSLKIDNKFTQNQWKSSSKLRENQLKLNKILIKLIIKLSYFWTKLT